MMYGHMVDVYVGECWNIAKLWYDVDENVTNTLHNINK